MANSTTGDPRTTEELNKRAFAAKVKRRLEKANYSVEHKWEIAEKLRQASRELRSGTVVSRGSIKRD